MYFSDGLRAFVHLYWSLLGSSCEVFIPFYRNRSQRSSRATTSCHFRHIEWIRMGMLDLLAVYAQTIIPRSSEVFTRTPQGIMFRANRIINLQANILLGSRELKSDQSMMLLLPILLLKI